MIEFSFIVSIFAVSPADHGSSPHQENIVGCTQGEAPTFTRYCYSEFSELTILFQEIPENAAIIIGFDLLRLTSLKAILNLLIMIFFS